jgi:hypothetical protein
MPETSKESATYAARHVLRISVHGRPFNGFLAPSYSGLAISFGRNGTGHDSVDRTYQWDEGNLGHMERSSYCLKVVQLEHG